MRRRLYCVALAVNIPLGLVQHLSLCRLLVVPNTFINGLGLATTPTLLASNVTESLIRGHRRPEIRMAVYLLVVAAIVTATELVMNG